MNLEINFACVFFLVCEVYIGMREHASWIWHALELHGCTDVHTGVGLRLLGYHTFSIHKLNQLFGNVFNLERV